MKIRKSLILRMTIALLVGIIVWGTQAQANDLSQLEDSLDFDQLILTALYMNYTDYVELGDYTSFKQADFLGYNDLELQTFKYLEVATQKSTITGYPQRFSDSFDEVSAFVVKVLKYYKSEQFSGALDNMEINMLELKRWIYGLKDEIMVSYAIAYEVGLEPDIELTYDSVMEYVNGGTEDAIKQYLDFYEIDESIYTSFKNVMLGIYLMPEVEQYLSETYGLE